MITSASDLACLHTAGGQPRAATMTTISSPCAAVLTRPQIVAELDGRTDSSTASGRQGVVQTHSTCERAMFCHMSAPVC